MTLFWVIIAVTVAVVFLFETDMLLAGVVSSPMTQMWTAMIMQLITIAAIPSALYLFRTSAIKKSLTTDEQEAPRQLCRWGIVRLFLLGLPLVMNAVCYYLCGHDVRYFYLAIILVLSLFFIYPSIGRCENDCKPDKENNG